MINKKNYWIVLYLLLFLSNGCKNNPNPKEKITFERFDQAVFSQDIDELYTHYPEFTPFFMENIIQIGTEKDSLQGTYFKNFVDEYQNNVYDTIQSVFGDMQEIERQLGLALDNYRIFFPQDEIPQLYTHFSGFNEPIISINGIISVSLENYLGQSGYYGQLGVYQYLRIGMYPEKIARDVMKTLAYQKINPTNATDNLLANMIYQGKIIYFLQQHFPREKIVELMDYTEEQNKWNRRNEAMMWSYLVENKHLFSSDYRTIRAYIDPAPFTKYFPAESPGRAGVWIGYQIVNQYAKNTKTTLPNLIKNVDYQAILKESGYNPY